MDGLSGTEAADRFPFWGSPSLRQAAEIDPVHVEQSLPLLGKPFIEAFSPAWT